MVSSNRFVFLSITLLLGLLWSSSQVIAANPISTIDNDPPDGESPEAQRKILEIGRLSEDLSNALDALTEVEKGAVALLKAVDELGESFGSPADSELSQLYSVIQKQLVSKSNPTALRLQLVTATGEIIAAARRESEGIRSFEKLRASLVEQGEKVFSPVDSLNDKLSDLADDFKQEFSEPTKEQLVQLAITGRVLKLASAKVEAYEGTTDGSESGWDDKLRDTKDRLTNFGGLIEGLRADGAQRLLEIVDADLNPQSPRNDFKGLGVTALGELVDSPENNKAELVSLLQFRLPDERNVVRRKVLHAIATLGDDAINELAGALTHSDPYIRIMASRELLALSAKTKKPIEVRKAILAVLEDSYPYPSAQTTAAAIASLRQLSLRLSSDESEKEKTESSDGEASGEVLDAEDSSAG